MKRLSLLLISLMCVNFAFSQGWNARLVSSTENEIIINVEIDRFTANAVSTPNGDAVVITNKKMANIMKAGEPDIPSFPIPTVIGDHALMNVEVVDTQYTDYENVNVAPSKGDFPRSINPDDVPYTYSLVYQQDAFFPTHIVKLDEPYIHRDVRGQNMIVTPYAYNPVTKTLRVFDSFTLRMFKTGIDTRNVLERRSNVVKMDPETKIAYGKRYINYAESQAKYTAIEETGELLIICHDDFMTAMEPFVAWKKQIGRPTTMVGTSVAGTTEDVIKSYISNYYNENPTLTDVLLVGDIEQIPGIYISAGSGASGYSGYGDAQYGQVTGNDYYNELIIGRFCCETEEQVTNHVNKVINYERDLDAAASWLSVGIGVSTTSQAAGGHNNEMDFQHIDSIKAKLLDYNYSNVYRDYSGVDGTTASNAADVSTHINDGVSIINYCNHGNITGWSVFSYSNSHVNNLTNDYKLPFIISVACLNGKYDNYGNDCFAEAWMRATNNTTGEPTGAIGGMFSYIEQPWEPPMFGQDEMVDILTESFENNIKRTMGGVSGNGNLTILDLGATQNENKGTYNTWILFGDPTLTLRNEIPANQLINNAETLSPTATSYTFAALSGNGSTATLKFNGEVIGSTLINGMSATIEFDAIGEEGQAILTIFGYNKQTYIDTIAVVEEGAVSCPAPENYEGEYYWEDYEFGARLAWDKASYESELEKFEVYRSTNGVDYELIKRIVNVPYMSHYECLDLLEEAGDYYYRLIAYYMDDCSSEPIEILVNVTSVEENAENNVSIYPNPTSGKFTISAKAMQKVEIINSLGQIILTQNVDNDEVNLDLTTLESGVYFVNIVTENGNIIKTISVK